MKQLFLYSIPAVVAMAALHIVKDQFHYSIKANYYNSYAKNIKKTIQTTDIQSNLIKLEHIQHDNIWRKQKVQLDSN